MKWSLVKLNLFSCWYLWTVSLWNINKGLKKKQEDIAERLAFHWRIICCSIEELSDFSFQQESTPAHIQRRLDISLKTSASCSSFFLLLLLLFCFFFASQRSDPNSVENIWAHIKRKQNEKKNQHWSNLAFISIRNWSKFYGQVLNI